MIVPTEIPHPSPAPHFKTTFGYPFGFEAETTTTFPKSVDRLARVDVMHVFSMRYELNFKVMFNKTPSLTFRGPCIVMYSYNESPRDALFLKFI
jgi:hypothetical protein